ncbi:MAG TPA: protein-methionine-sulfoxide reductase heme-binding subunit MsrQ [Pyrinomonadaceae bacterium]|jgi:sulfoxide reductase heme-binding subunit YedZ|nr:protein-methionine-sulfoxide reductase heme-binding subunit MsrQ [Pyrinomonadaceae bacterium]
MSTIRFSKLVILVNALIPLVLLLWDLYHHNVGANPQEFAIRTTGMLTLVFLTLTIAITPLRKTFGANSLVKLRRMIGLFAFFYGALHLLTYLWLDRLFDFLSVTQDVARRPFILVGMTAFFLMAPLAITSTNKMVKRLGGKTWARLHRVVYVAAVAGVVHFWLLVKSDTRLPLTFGFIIGLLLAHRLFLKFAPSQPPQSTAGLFPKD